MFQIAEVRDDEMTEKPGRKALFTGGPGKKPINNLESEITDSISVIVTYLEQRDRSRKLESDLVIPLLQPLVNLINIFVEEMERTIERSRMSEELFSKNPVPMVLQDNNSHVHALNEAYANLMGSTVDELSEEGVTHCSIETESGDDPSSIYRGKNRALAELKVLYENGQERFVQLEAVPLSNGVEGQTLGLFVFHDRSNIRVLESQTKKFEKELNSAIFGFQKFVGENPVPMVVIDPDFQIIEINDEFKKLVSPDNELSGTRSSPRRTAPPCPGTAAR